MENENDLITITRKELADRETKARKEGGEKIYRAVLQSKDNPMSNIAMGPLLTAVEAAQKALQDLE